MEPGRVWNEADWPFHGGSEEEGAGEVSGTTNRKGGQNFSIERILGQVQSAHLGEGRAEHQSEEEHNDEQGDGEGEGDVEEEYEEDEEGDDIITNQDHHLKNANLHLGLSPSSQANSSTSRVQPILPRPPHLAAPPLNICPRPSLLSQDPFLLSPLQSPRYTITEEQSCRTNSYCNATKSASFQNSE